VFGASCARLLVQAVRHGWEETLLEICDQAEAGGCLKEVLGGAILGGAPLLVHAAMCGQTVMTAHVLEVLRCISMLEDISQWRDSAMISAMHWSARFADKRLLQLLVTHCPRDVMAEAKHVTRHRPQSSGSVVTGSSAALEGSSSNHLTTHPAVVSPRDAAVVERRAPPLPGACMAHVLSEWPMPLFGSLFLLTLVGTEAARSAAWVTERNVLYVVIWMVAFVLFPWAHKALLQKTFDHVFYQAARHGLGVSTSLSFTDPTVRKSYGMWVIHNMGWWWWLFVEGVQIWWPALAQLRKALSAHLPMYWNAASIVLLCLLSRCRWKAIRKGDLETMQWTSLSIAIVMHIKFAPTWSAHPPSFFSFSWPYFIASMFGLRLGICLLQLISELGPMLWLHSTRFALTLLTALMVGLALSTAQRDQPDRVFQPLWLYYSAVGGFHWLSYWVLRFLLEGNRMSLYIRHVQGKTK